MQRARAPLSVFAKAARPVLFRSTVEGNEYFSTPGGCVTVGLFQGRAIGITCKHVLKGYAPSDLFVIERFEGETSRSANVFVNIAGITDDTEGSEIEDLVIIGWADPQPDFIASELVDFERAADSELRDEVVAVGFPKGETSVDGRCAKAFCLELHTHDTGEFGSKLHLRSCGGQHDEGFEFDNLAGFSGGLVYNKAKVGPAGIIVRGGVEGGKIRIYFVPIGQVLEALRREFPKIERKLAELSS